MKPTALAAAAALSVGLLGAGNACAATILVTSSADSGSGSLRDAIGLANLSAGNTIQFDDALKGSTITLTTGQILITKPMSVEGPGAGLLTISGNDQSRIFCANTYSANYVYIRNMTLVHGNANGSDGGALCADHAYLELSGVTVAGSSARNGGAVYVTYGALNILGSRLIGNHASKNGGAIAVNLVVALQVLFSTISGNTAAAYGGGVFVYECGLLQISTSTISGNVIPDPQGPVNVGGGGIAIRSTAANTQLIQDSTITNNYAFDFGGGIAVLDALSGGHFIVNRTTIAGNSSAGSAGNGISAVSGVTVTVDHTIVGANASAAGNSDLVGTFNLQTSLVQEPDSATITPASSGNVLLLAPQLGPLGDHGGVTRTMLPADSSPAIDAGPACSPIPDLDQRSEPRCVNGKQDIGSVERQYPENIIFRDGVDLS